MHRIAPHLLIITMVAGVVLFTNLGSARLWDRDEPRNAGCALEMMERGNLIVPVFNDELRPQKPVLLYWLIISAYQIFGVGEFAARFWSAILGIGTVLATYGIGCRLFSPMAAFLGAVVLASSLMFVVAGRAATPDSVLIFCSTLATLFYVRGTFSRKQHPEDAATLRSPGQFFPQSGGIVLAMYGMMGLGVLAKGPVGFVLPCAIIGMFMLIQRLPPLEDHVANERGWLARWLWIVARPFEPRHFLKTLWSMRPCTLAAVVLVVAVPWYLMVGLQTNGDWPRQFLLSENLARATSSFENHRGGWLYYPVAILLGFFPWSVFALPMLVGIDRQMTRKHPWSMAYTFVICWVLVQVVLFSFAATKLPSYITPCYPALALLTGAFLSQLVTNQPVKVSTLHRLPFILFILSGLVITVALVAIAKIYLASDYKIAMIGAVPLVGGAIALRFWVHHQTRLAIVTFCIAAVAFEIGVFGFGTVAVDRHRQANRILERVAHGNQAVAAFGCLESSWVYYAGKPVYELSAEKRFDAWSDTRTNPWHRKEWPSPEQFVTTHPNALIITTGEELDRLSSRLPEDYGVIEQVPFFLRNTHLVLLGRQSVDHTARLRDESRR